MTDKLKSVLITDTEFAKRVAAELTANIQNHQAEMQRLEAEVNAQAKVVGEAATARNNEIWKEIYDHCGVDESDRQNWGLDTTYLETAGIAVISMDAPEPEVDLSATFERLLAKLSGRGDVIEGEAEHV